MTDAQFYNVMLITGVSQVAAIIFCGIAVFVPRLSKEAREFFFLLWLILSILLPYLDTGINIVIRGGMFAALVWAGCVFVKYFWDKRRKVAFFIQLFVSYLAFVGYLLARVAH